MAKTIKKKRCSIAVSLTVATAAFLIVGYVLGVPWLGFSPAFEKLLGNPPHSARDVVLALLNFVPGIAIGGFVGYGTFKRMRWRSMKRDQRYCEKCEYDLTGNESGFCPECGMAIKSA